MTTEEDRRIHPTKMRLAIFGAPTFPVPLSTVVSYPCPWCMEVNQRTGHVRPIPRMTKCRTCNDTRAVMLPGLWPGATALLEPKKEKP